MEKQLFELTNPQKSIWLTEQYHKGTSINNIAGTLIIQEKVNFDLLEKAVNHFIKANDSLRIQLTLEADSIKQYILPYEWQNIETVYLNTSTLQDLEKEVISKPFDFFNHFLHQFIILKFPDGTGGFIAKLHHIISDAWTMSLLINEIMNNYSSLLKGAPIESQGKFPSYLDFITTEQKHFSSANFIKSQKFWNEQFSEDLSLTYINNKFSNSCEAKRLEFSLENSKVISDFCKEKNMSTYSLFISILGIYLAQIHDTNYFIIGSPILNRSNFAEKNTTGMFVNTVAFKGNLSFNDTFTEYSNNITKHSFSVFRNQKYPYNLLLNDVRKKTGITKNLFDIAISYQNARDNSNELDIPYSSHWLFNNCVSNNIDLHIYDMDNTGTLTLFYDYKTDLFTEEMIKSLHYRLMHILEQVLKNPNILLKDIEIVTPQEKQFLLETYNNTTTEYPYSTPVYRLFEQQAELIPENIAIADSCHEWSYCMLNYAANHLAKLMQSMGLQRQDRVCLFFNNSIELVTSILACLKLGIIYIPIDTAYPLTRIQYIINNSDAKKIFTNTKNCEKLSSLENFSSIGYVLNFEDLNACYCKNPDITVSEEDIAYIIYTSGSTGNPKGVQIANQSLTNYIWWGAKQYVGKDRTNFPLYSSIAFDLTVTSIYIPLITGNAIYIYENDNPELLLKSIITENKVQIIKLTPAHLSLLLECISTPTEVCKLIVGGDLLPIELCSKIETAFDNKVSIFNEYGPTEATVGCMIYQYTNKDNYASVPIGVPIDNTKIYIFNDNFQLVPPGQNGQMYIEGDCLAKGYWNLEEMTASRFIDSPFHSGRKLYKTGDISKIHENGIMEYIGRNDFQVKINGYRIEIGEIQSRILNFPDIKDCYVSVLTLTNKVICAYYVSDKNINLDTLRSYLFNSLPPYMVPKYFVKLDAIPLTPNGKIAKALLPMPKQRVSNNEYIAPETELEKILHSVFCELLKLPKISITSNLFDYYIDSLLLIKAQTLLYTKGYSINTQDFYEHTTIKDLAQFILTHSNSISDIKSIEIPELSTFQKKTSIAPNLSKILLVGATGFLGIHILYELLEKTEAHIFCLVRNKDNINNKDRFREKFTYYFSKQDLAKYKDRITILSGNLLKEHLGLSNSSYEELGKDVDIVIDTAAIVKHYGDYSLFKNTNVSGTQKVVEFCETYNIPLHYVSTMSVSGYGLVQAPQNSIFTENELYIGQSYKDNVYVRSKFEAECYIFQECKENRLVASIYRVGNITNRYSDGFFQENSGENAFLNRLISFINLKSIPRECLNTPVEFTPVDVLAHFIVILLNHQDCNLKVYHLFNNNTIMLSNFLVILKDLSIHLSIVSLEEFKKLLLSASSNYFGITNYIQNLNSSFGNVLLKNTETNNLLESIGITWPIIDESYISKIIDYLKNQNYIGGNHEE